MLLDACVWGKVTSELQKSGHDVIWIGDWENDPGDEEVLKFAYREKRIFVTLDKDFGELAIVRKQYHSGIIRLVNISAKKQAFVCSIIIEKYQRELLAGAIITAEPGRLRIRPA